MRPVALYEANYINAAGYWLAFHRSAIELRQEALRSEEDQKAKRCDVWALLGVRYALRALGLRTEFYKMAADDPTTAKMLLPALEHRQDLPAADNLVEDLEKLDSHMTTQLMKAVATLKTTTATKKAGGKGGAADGH